MGAVQRAYCDTVSLLLEAGADVGAVDKVHMMCFHGLTAVELDSILA
jgi:hypothetical protein